MEDLLLALILMAQSAGAAAVEVPELPMDLQVDPVCIYDTPGAIYDTHCVYQ